MRPRLRPLSALPAPVVRAAWNLAELRGRLVEISGLQAGATLTAAFGLVLDAQRVDEPTTWITLRESSFFPPDAAEGGVDLDHVPVVRAPDARTAAWAGDQLVRSGGFGLVVLDLGGQVPGREASAPPRVPVALQQRLAGLAQTHGTAVVFLTGKPAEAPSLGSLIALRAEARRLPGFDAAGPEAAGFPCRIEVRVLKDKRRGPGRTHEEVCRGPAGVY